MLSSLTSSQIKKVATESRERHLTAETDDSDIEEISPPVQAHQPSPSPEQSSPLNEEETLMQFDDCYTSECEEPTPPANYLEFIKDRNQAAIVAKHLFKIKTQRQRQNKLINTCLLKRIDGMFGLCNLYWRPGSKFLWMEASIIAANAEAHGTWFAHRLRHWVIEFERKGMEYAALPHTHHREFKSCHLVDEDLSAKIHAHLLQL